MKTSVRTITRVALVAALYAAVTMAIAPIAFGPIQARISEVMTILPFFFPETTVGLVLGCAIANTMSMYGLADIIFGSLATLLSSLVIVWLGKIGRESITCKVLACLQPVIFNGIIVSAVIAFSSAQGGAFWQVFAINALQIGLAEFIILFVVGLPAMIWLPKSDLYCRLKNNHI